MVRLACLAVALTACTASSEQVQPPQEQFYFPNGLALSPDERYLFVSNANADLRYDSGTLQVIDLDAVEAKVAAWLPDLDDPPDGCTQDDALRHQVVCDESQLMLGEATIRVGNFAGEVVVQPLDDGRLRLFTPVRGDPSLTWVDFDPAARTLDCGGAGNYPLCDDAHRLIRLFDDPEGVGLGDEPFGIYVDSTLGYVVITHLTTGFVTLANAPPDGAAPQLVDLAGPFFSPNASNVRGATGVAGRQPGTDGGLVYVTSRSEARIQTLYVVRTADGLPHIAPAEFFVLNPLSPFIGNVSPAPFDDGRDLLFTADGSRAYVVNRKPPALIALDTSIDATGQPANQVAGMVELCSQPASVELIDAGRGPRAYVSCFRNGQVWVVDPEEMVLESIIDVGRGPSAVLASPSRNLLFVSNFLEDSLAVIDIRPGEVTEHQVVVRLGTSRQEGND